jgi:D-apionolactonase
MTREIDLGQVSVRLDGLDLRYLEVDGVEVLRRVFVTIRDAEWATPELADVATEVEETGNGVAIAGSARARLGEIDATCEVRARIDAGGAIEYAVQWSPNAAFAYSRMGLCVLHPPATSAGRAYRSWSPDGEGEGRLPTLIGPQLVIDGELQPLFPAFAELELDVAGLGPCRFAFTGDLFEMEDQRNWSDGSFKTYCTPLGRPLPHAAEPGRPIRQSVRVELPPRPSSAPRRRPDVVAAPRQRPDVVELRCEATPEGAIPRIGLCLRASPPPAIGRLGLHHVRVELRRSDTAAAELADAAAIAQEIGCGLLVAAHVPIGAEVFAPHAEVISHVLAFAGDRPAVVSVAGGTDDWFVELNRARPDPAGLDAIAWSVTPQVHAGDELTMVEGLAAQTDQLATAAAFAPGLARLVGPITLRPRSQPPDPRQDTPFAAAWTAASIAAQAAGGAWSATYYETHGPGGVVDFPVFDVLVDACRWQGRRRLRCTSSAPLAAQLLVVDGEAREGWMVNLRAVPTRVRLSGLGDGDGVVELEPWAVRRV